jgi:hypothetical protein
MADMFWRKYKSEPDLLTLTASMPDPSDAHNYTVLMNKILMAVVVFLAVALGVMAYLNALLSVKPPTTIVLDRRSDLPPQVFTTSEPPPFAIEDARNFFINMVKLRYGWSSTTVARDISEFQRFSLEQQRLADDRYFSESVEVPGDAYRAKKRRMAMLSEAGIQNQILLPSTMDQVACVHDADKTAWHCRMRIKQITEYTKLSLDQPPALREPSQERMMVVYGTLLEGKHTVANPFGMMVGRMEGHEPPDKEDT